MTSFSWASLLVNELRMIYTVLFWKGGKSCLHIIPWTCATTSTVSVVIPLFFTALKTNNFSSFAAMIPNARGQWFSWSPEKNDMPVIISYENFTFVLRDSWKPELIFVRRSVANLSNSFAKRWLCVRSFNFLVFTYLRFPGRNWHPWRFITTVVRACDHD